MIFSRCGFNTVANNRLHLTKKQPLPPGLSQNLSLSTIFAVKTISPGEHPADFAYTHVPDVCWIYQEVRHLVFYTVSVVSIKGLNVDVALTPFSQTVVILPSPGLRYVPTFHLILL